MPISHLGVVVRDVKKSQELYLAALTPLGYKVVLYENNGKTAVLGQTAPEFFLAERTPDRDAPKGEYIHLAFVANSPEQVDQVYAGALSAGAKDNGPPGLRPQYGPTYYAAFFYDLEGRNIEACYIGPKA
ncbi:hypothetical protein JR316_0009836 [Psilocybe cubensis]|uniref:VOC domain-containing protein n=2 Tax=Psilocybe cubensis TaxID=181762 RepID=A0A8H7XMW7_PSICU|nr:hypothetical protein JR316_0009836 [Psilocybe cubensis]KAH9477612.1 hypothetical protein JR316_0009836 [Psilocybe cubensis]